MNRIQQGGASEVTLRSRASGARNEWVVLLRGINVGKAKRVPMPELRAALEDRGHTQVRTVLATGNVISRTRATGALAVATAVREVIAEQFDVECNAVALSAQDFLEVAEERPFEGEPEIEAKVEESPKHLLVQFLIPGFDAGAIRELESRDWGEERMVVSQHALFCWCPRGVLDSQLPAAISKGPLSKGLRDHITARNLSTVRRIARLIG